MHVINKWAGAIYRACSNIPSVSRLKARHAKQIEAGGTHISANWLSRQLQITSISTFAVALSAPLALLGVAIQPGLPFWARLFGALLVFALTFVVAVSDTAKVLAIREHLQLLSRREDTL